jgi:hypothetical protein
MVQLDSLAKKFLPSTTLNIHSQDELHFTYIIIIFSHDATMTSVLCSVNDAISR